MKLVSIIIIHKFIKFGSNTRALGSPPEPVPIRFMEGSPQNRDLLLLELPKFNGYYVHIMEKCLSLRCSQNQYLLCIKVGIPGIEALITTTNR